MKALFLSSLIAVFIFHTKNAIGQLKMANPSSVYSSYMCYETETRNSQYGESGYVLFPDGSECEEWDFYLGICGQDFSYCVQKGYSIINIEEDINIYTSSYAACYNTNGDTIEMQKLIDSLGYKDCPTSIYSLNKRKGIIDEFPNPINNHLKLKSQVIIYNYKIFSISGSIVLTGKINSKETTINLSTIDDGIYALVLITERGQYNKTIIKNSN